MKVRPDYQDHAREVWLRIQNRLISTVTADMRIKIMWNKGLCSFVHTAKTAPRLSPIPTARIESEKIAVLSYSPVLKDIML